MSDFSDWKYDKEWQRAFREGAISVNDYPAALGERIYIDPKLWPPQQVPGEKVQPLATKAQLAYQKKIEHNHSAAISRAMGCTFLRGRPGM